jgi:hypothetical protein
MNPRFIRLAPIIISRTPNLTDSKAKRSWKSECHSNRFELELSLAPSPPATRSL